MNYFEILDLRAEPFSNTPDPDFLYRSAGHENCLHTLEISLRLRRGLCVVLGEVGTGKTTLCREFLRVLSEDEAVTAHLVLDPGFSSPREMLTTLHSLFYRDRGAAALSDWQLKEDIKHALFEYGKDQDRLLCLIFDEGQKLSPPCLEVLRELLNYETNDRKLLQIVIFAQTEFRDALEAMPNLKDRVNDIIALEPLSLAETKAMVRHRLDRAKAGYSPPELFSALGYLALYRLTGGYPRRIVRLGHKVVLALILNQRRKAGLRLVRACARGGKPEPAPRWARLVPAALVLCLLALLAWPASLRLPPEPPETPHSGSAHGEPTFRAPADAAHSPLATPAAAATQAAPAAAPGPAQAPAGPGPKSLGQVRVQAGEHISLLTRMAYGSFNRATLQALLDANPGMQNPDRIEVGQDIRFPAQDMAFQRTWLVPLAQAGTLAKAVALWRAGQPLEDPQILACRDENQGLRFVLTSGGGHETEAQAARPGRPAPVRSWALAFPEDQPLARMAALSARAQAQPGQTPPRPPAFLGKVDMLSGEDAPMLARVVYGDAGQRTLAALRGANPVLARSMRGGPGKTLRFPLAGLSFGDAWWVPLAEARTLAGALALWRAAPFLAEARILGWWDGQGALRFIVAAGPPCASEAQARREARAKGIPTPPMHGTALLSPDAPRAQEHASARHGGEKEQQ